MSSVERYGFDLIIERVMYRFLQWFSSHRAKEMDVVAIAAVLLTDHKLTPRYRHLSDTEVLALVP